MFNVGGFVDRNFATNTIKITRYLNEYIDGIYVSSSAKGLAQHGSSQHGREQYQDPDAVSRPNIEVDVESEHRANVQPLNPKERRALEEGGQRLIDGKKIYISDGSTPQVFPSDRIHIEGLDGEYELIQSDIRAERKYCKLIVSKVDA